LSKVGADQQIEVSKRYRGIVRDIALGDLLREAARESGDKLAIVDGVHDPALRRRWTYSQLLAEAEQVARGLLARFEPGSRIALCSPNTPEWIILEFGILLAGMILVQANPAYTESELAGILQDSEAHALFHVDAWRSNDIAASARSIKATVLPELELLSFSDWDEFLANAPTTGDLPVLGPRDPALIQFTSGTTGRPKGAILHNGFHNPPRFVADCCEMRHHGVWLNCMPMYHIGGAVVSLFATFSRHGCFVQMREWDPQLALDLIQAEHCNGTLMVPTMVVAMLDHPDFDKYDLSSLDFIMAGGSPVAPALLERVTKRIGCPMLICFGLTESGGPTTNTARDDGAYELANTIGRALPGVEVEVHDPETGANLPTGTMGELCFRGPQIMLGYYGREADTRATITPDGWLKSGDLGSIDEKGYVSISGRLKDMIIRGGVNIYPREIEDCLYTHPAVAQAAIVGLPDEKWGEILLAAVQPAEGQHLDFAELRQFCRERLASFKVPAMWTEIDALPLNPTGKFNKNALLEMVRAGQLNPVSVR